VLGVKRVWEKSSKHKIEIQREGGRVYTANEIKNTRDV